MGNIRDAIKGVDIKMSKEETDALRFVMDTNRKFQDVASEESREAARLRKVKEKKEKEEAEAAAEKKLRESLSSNQFLLTDLTDGRLPKSQKNHVLFRYPKGTWGPEHECNIPKINENYYWDADLLEELWLSYICNFKVLASGPPGAGKTSAGHQLCAHIGQPYARFNGKKGLEPASILGYAWAEGGQMVWKDGIVTQAVEHGYYLAIDEIFKIPPGIQMAMQALYEDDGFLMLDEKPGTIEDKRVTPRKEFRILGTDNTKGTGDDLDLYSSGEMQDISTLDRFHMTMNVGYLPKAIESQVLRKMHPNLKEGTADRMTNYARLVRTAFLENGDLTLTLSLRGLSAMAKLIEQGVSLKRAIELVYVNKLGDDSEIEVAKRFITNAI